ncbi:alpha/beta fold hydrolase [Nocardia arthritidis]|uniref:Alpha/beta fold hydrolase n=1 Tax=Nocardia arthritidis TaxID=228602 RepID=A0A6G9Y5L5_9NOCA|nr:alpha/beta hydrolase [Nocardia arthritidis]QIS08390.1 alpha/beta fold hydrolase [Nocardia arthritidis]
MREQTIRPIPVDGGVLPVNITAGQGITAILLHYWGGSHRTFTPVIERLSPEIGTVTFDHRGWGASRQLPGPYDLTQLAEDVLRVIAELELSDYILVGHSMGGKVAQLVAARRPAGLAGAVLIAPGPPRPASVTPEAQQALSRAYDSAQTVTAAIDYALTHRPLTETQRAQVISDSLAATPAARLAWPLHGIAADISTEAAQIDVPVTVLAGEYDGVEPPATLATHLLPLIPQATMRVVRDTGHLLPLEAPDAIASAITEFARRQTDRRLPTG